MFISTQALPQAVKDYVQEVIFPKAPTPLAQFGVGFMLPYVNRMVDQKVAQASPALLALGVIDEHGKIDLDQAKAAAVQALEKAGGKLAIAGYSADMSDIDALYAIAQRYATSE